MLIRRELELNSVAKANICITRVEGYPHTEAFREIAERIEAECRRKSIDCSVKHEIEKSADINFVWGLNDPSKYKNEQKKKLTIINLERLTSLEANNNNAIYIELLSETEFIDFDSEN